MTAKSDFLESKIIDDWLAIANAARTRPTSHTIHLYVTSPGENTGGTEQAGEGYTAQAVTWRNDGQVGGGGCQASNNGTVTYPAASGGNYDGPIVAFATKDHVPNILYFGPLLVSVTVNQGDQFKFLDGAAKIEER